MSSNKDGPLIVGKQDAVDFGRLIGDYRSGKFNPVIEDDAPRRRARGIRCDTVMLLENLNGSRVAWGEILSLDVESFITDVVVLGWPPAHLESVEIVVGGSTVYQVPLNATAQEFAEITGVTGEVSLGSQIVTDDKGDEVLLVPARWRIRWESEDVAEKIDPGQAGQQYIVRTERTLLTGTGNLVQLVQTIPTGWDTPLRAGAICEAVRGNGAYYKVIGAEARFWYGTTITSSGSVE